MRGRRSRLPAEKTTDADRAAVRAERAILVGVDFTGRSAKNRAGVAAARLAASQRDATHDETRQLGEESTEPRPSAEGGFGVEESLAEFRELVASAGAEVAAELLQRRPRPDPATLVGAGKVEEIAGVAASPEADLVLFDPDLSPTQLRNLEAAL